MQLDGGECSEKFDVGQGLGQEFVSVPLLLFNMHMFDGGAACRRETRPHWCTRHDIVQLRRKKDKGEKKAVGGKSRRRGVKKEEEEMEAQELWSMLYADDAGIVLRSPGGLESRW